MKPDFYALRHLDHLINNWNAAKHRVWSLVPDPLDRPAVIRSLAQIGDYTYRAHKAINTLNSLIGTHETESLLHHAHKARSFAKQFGLSINDDNPTPYE